MFFYYNLPKGGNSLKKSSFPTLKYKEGFLFDVYISFRLEKYRYFVRCLSGNLKIVKTFIILIALFFSFFSVYGFSKSLNKSVNSDETKLASGVNFLPPLFNEDLAEAFLEIGETEMAEDEVSFAFEKLIFFGENYLDSPEGYIEVLSLFDFCYYNGLKIGGYGESEKEEEGGESSPLENLVNQNPGSVRVEVDIEDEMRRKIESLKFDFPVVVNEKVMNWINYLLYGNGSQMLLRGLRRLGRYEKVFRKIFKEMGIPSDLIYFGFIESNFNPYAYSRAGARGIWQFMPSTARRYGLRVNWWIDERCDPIKSTYAACKYLKNVYSIFGDWYLSLAAYNYGEGNVLRLMKRCGAKNYWELSRCRGMPSETRAYVPLILAAIVICKNPEIFDLDVKKEPPLKYQVVSIPSPTDIRVVSDILKVSVSRIKEFNPQLKRYLTPPYVRRYKIYLPEGVDGEKLAFLFNVPKYRRMKWVRYKVKRGDTLIGIALKFGSSVSAIKRVNHIRNARRLRVGQVLSIPLNPVGSIHVKRVASGKHRKKIFKGVGSSTQRRLSSKRRRGRRYRVYVVKRGDSLWKIARKFGVSVRDLKRINGFSGIGVLKIGTRVKVPIYTGWSSSGNYFVYRIRRGDTLGKIARIFGVSKRRLCKLNNLSTRSKLRYGRTIKIPFSGFIKHRVRRGETLSKISKRYGVKISALKIINNLKKSRIYRNQVLIIPVKRIK